MKQPYSLMVAQLMYGRHPPITKHMLHIQSSYIASYSPFQTVVYLKLTDHCLTTIFGWTFRQHSCSHWFVVGLKMTLSDIYRYNWVSLIHGFYGNYFVSKKWDYIQFKLKQFACIVVYVHW